MNMTSSEDVLDILREDFDAPTTISEAAKYSIMYALYVTTVHQLNKELKQILLNNAAAHNRSTNEVYTLFFDGKARGLLSVMPHHEEKSNVFCLPLHETLKPGEQNIRNLVEEIESVREEIYQVDRFISHLVTIRIPMSKLREYLGETLTNLMQKVPAKYNVWAFKPVLEDEITTNWHQNSEEMLKALIEPNKEIINKMKERILLNLITLE